MTAYCVPLLDHGELARLLRSEKARGVVASEIRVTHLERALPLHSP
jgi:hypothetical protein